MALQGYGDDLAGRMNELNLVDLFLHTVPQETPPTITPSQEHLLSPFTDVRICLII